MYEIKKIATLLFVIAYTVSAFASGKFPRGCEVTGFQYDDNYLVINQTGKQSYYLIQNTSDERIEIERHETRDVFMSPPLQATLNPGHWAAFASDIPDLYFKCYQHGKASPEIINCSDVIDICQYPRVQFALSNMGNYWVATNKSQQQVIRDSVSKGIYLKW